MIRAALAALALGLGCGSNVVAPTVVPVPVAAPVPDAAPTMAVDAPTVAWVPAWLAPYQADVARIIAAATVDVGPTTGAYARLAYLTDHIGHRLAGSPQLDAAIDWAAAVMRSDGHDVHREPVMVPHWVRGAESATLLAPGVAGPRPMRILGLGGTVATAKRGLTAEVMVVHAWDELTARAAEAKGKIVLFDVAMPAWSETAGTGYGSVVGYRWASAIAAGKLGAVAVLMRSVTAHSLSTPHTGSLGYDDQVTPKIPAAAVTVEDATLITRLVEGGSKVQVKLVLSGKQLPDVPSANVIGELRGRTMPDEVVLIGGHLDSWDVGQGAHDDGAGCAIMMQALTLLRQLGLTPQRTIRVVLFTNEENGTRGARGYFAAHEAEVGKHVLAIEADMGGFAPRGFDLELPTAPDGDAAWTPPWDATTVEDRLRSIATLLAPVGADRIGHGHAGTDIGWLTKRGVVGLGLAVDDRTYFDIHHTDADTLDKVDPGALAGNVAAVAALAYIVADLPQRIDAP